MALSKHPAAAAIRSGAQNAARALLAIALAPGVACATGSAAAGQSAELKEHVDMITRSGMSEVAVVYLQHVAELRVGMPIGCPLPGADIKKFAERQARLHELAERDVQILKVQADADGSGFVSTQEAKDFSNLLRFGYKAAHIAEVEGRADAGTIAKGAGIEPQEVPARVKEYNRIATKLNEGPGDTKMPLIPVSQ